jgi:hypothetical protein
VPSSESIAQASSSDTHAAPCGGCVAVLLKSILILEVRAQAEVRLARNAEQAVVRADARLDAPGVIFA